ncbi:E3 ubiquitin-protein ligase UPL6-like [Triticum aestivum]|uniref:E3 ubiquitin-protein ligase UPL6-like n=1 Tax=Triticum aestivum TaxID=4565 RepID=UPI001D01FFCC|nr:E3 ubiquitin-protein ligase UPL6-like [Triticum aestivum]
MPFSGDLTERNRQLLLEQQNSSAIKIQRCFRGKKAIQSKRSEARENFCSTFEGFFQNLDRKSYVASDFLGQFLLFFDAKEDKDIDILCQVCDLLLQYAKRDGKYDAKNNILVMF